MPTLSAAPPTPRSSTAATDPLASLATEVLEVVLEHDEQGSGVERGEIVARIPEADDRVRRAIAHLEDDGVLAAAATSVRLTAAGRPVAISAVRRHRLTERLLADVIGLEWWKVHHEAARWAGVVTGDVEARLVEVLGDPGSCPHGNPIPGSANRVEHPAAVRLADAGPGPVRVVRITETLEGDDEALQLLQNAGFLPGLDAEIQDRQGGWVQVAGAFRDAALPPHVAEHTYVVAC